MKGSRLALVIVVVVGLVYSWIAVGLRPFTKPEDLVVALPVIPVLVLALLWRGPDPDPAAATPGAASRGTAVWIVLLGALVAWELAAYASTPRDDHPTLSSIADSIMSTHAGRAAIFALWLVLGAALAFGRSRGGPAVTSRTFTFLGFAVIIGAAIVWSVVAARSPTLITLPRLLARLTRSRVVRVLFVIGWAWLGWHLFARGSGAFE